MSCSVRVWAPVAGRCRLSTTRSSSLRVSSCHQKRFMSAASSDLGPLRSLLQVSDEVAQAIATDKPVVALESTIYTHGAMGKGLAQEHVDLVRSHGGIPAIIGIFNGVPTVGLTPEQIVRMIEAEGTSKVSRRDIAFLVGMGLAGNKKHGGTTIAGTMVLARMAGIRVFGTGGLGGVHRGGHNSMDVSADLTELGRTRVAVVSAGCKGFLDIPRTLEYLETQGCLVSTFADGRPVSSVNVPAFWARDSGIKSPSVVQNEREAAAVILAQEKLGIESGMLFGNPIAEEHAIPAEEMSAAIEQAVAEADKAGFTGSNNTPFVLGRLRELTGGRTVGTNVTLVRGNIVRATNVAIELSAMLAPGWQPVSSSNTKPVISPTESTSMPSAAVDTKADILVAGSVAVDLTCDYTGTRKGDITPKADTSNPASIAQSIGGVGHNVALAAHRASSKTRVKLCSLIGNDLAGSTVLTSMNASGLDTTHVRRLGPEDSPQSNTAQYVAFNDTKGGLVMAMADMGIFADHYMPEVWENAVQSTKPSWLVVDGNWGEKDIKSWISAGKKQGANVAFEPVSVEKSMRLFSPYRSQQPPPLDIFPRASVDLASPNIYELSAMYSTAKENGYLDTMEWFEVIDALGMRGARERFVYLTSAELADAGVPVQSVQLLPYLPNIVTKLGSKGVLLTSLLRRDDPRLYERDAQEFILARSVGDSEVGGVYMRLFPPPEAVHDVVSVNGAGDTLLGVLVSGLAQGGSIEKLIDVAQRGAAMTLRSANAVSPRLPAIEEGLRRALRA